MRCGWLGSSMKPAGRQAVRPLTRRLIPDASAPAPSARLYNQLAGRYAIQGLDCSQILTQRQD